MEKPAPAQPALPGRAASKDRLTQLHKEKIMQRGKAVPLCHNSNVASRWMKGKTDRTGSLTAFFIGEDIGEVSNDGIPLMRELEQQLQTFGSHHRNKSSTIICTSKTEYPSPKTILTGEATPGCWEQPSAPRSKKTPWGQGRMMLRLEDLVLGCAL